jgi:alanine racemase
VIEDGDNVAVKSTDPSPLAARRPTWAEINLANLVHNFKIMKDEVGPDVAIMPAVKANAYGHGAVECARALESAGANWFGVALPEEGLELRDAGIARPILCMGSFWEGQEQSLADRNLTPVLFRFDLLERFDREARARGRVLDYHLKVDTGMGRLGVPFSQLGEFLDAASLFSNVKLDGVMTHFASADLPDKGRFTWEQIARLEATVEMVRSRGHKPSWIHQANSAAAHAIPEARGNMVRLGGAIYGLWGDSTDPTVAPLDWQPVLSLRSRVTFLKTVRAGATLGYGNTFVTARESRIATLPVGYDDGLKRALSNRGRVIVRGQFAPIVGRVSMDLTLVDVTEVVGLGLNDEVVIIGSQGGLQITAEDLAREIGSHSYEVTCGVGSRVPRVYRRHGNPGPGQ